MPFESARSANSRSRQGTSSHAVAADSIRGVGAFLLGLLIAAIGTAVAEAPFYSFRPTMPTMLRMSYPLDAAIAFGLGYCVYHRWRLAQWKWVGAAGVCWLGLGAFRLSAAGSHAI